jgi:hypothetical protein
LPTCAASRARSTFLYRVAEATVEHPDGIVREVVYPVVGEETLRDLVAEFRSTGPAYRLNVQAYLRASYRHHYRRMLPAILEALEFRSNNANGACLLAIRRGASRALPGSLPDRRSGRHHRRIG